MPASCKLSVTKQEIQTSLKKQFCCFNGTSYNKSNLRCGTPQGSYLGPLLFILYIDGFEDCLECMNPHIYADEICVNTASVNLNELLTALKNELENISNGMRTKQVRLDSSEI